MKHKEKKQRNANQRKPSSKLRESHTIRLSMSQNRINLLPRNKTTRNNPIPRNILIRLNNRSHPSNRSRNSSGGSLSLLDFPDPRIDTAPFAAESRKDSFH